METEEYKWRIDLVKSRYEYLKPTNKQAEQIYQYEEGKQIYIAGHYFTFWEELDYELSVFREILNSKQLKKYEQFRKDNIERYEQDLINSDGNKDQLKAIAFHEALLNFYETNVLPAFFDDPFTLYLGWPDEERSKMEYIKSEYKRYLSITKQALLIEHFRNYRIFQPNLLKLSLLRYKLDNVWPNYPSFKHKMDEPTKEMVKYLASKMSHLPEKLEALLKQKFQEIQDFNEQNFNKHYDDRRGWHVVIGSSSPEVEKEYCSMLLVLLDKNKYGC
jgi:hypothetical protein